MVAILRRVGVRLVIYLDDLLILNQTREGLIKDRDSTLHILLNLGWVINWKNSVLDPTQIIEFLGFKQDSSNMVGSVPQEKINNILLKCQALLQTSQTTIHELASLIRTLQSTVEAVVPAAFYANAPNKILLSSQNYKAKIFLTNQCKE